MTYFDQYNPIIDIIFPTPDQAAVRNAKRRANSHPSLAEKILKELKPFEDMTFKTENSPSKRDDTTVIHVGKDTNPEDISVELSPDAKTLVIEVKKEDRENGISRHMRQTYSSDKKIDYENMHVDLLDGDLVVFAPYVDDSPKKDVAPEIKVKHTPEVEDGFEKEQEDSLETP